jgi:hypothetical protein
MLFLSVTNWDSTRCAKYYFLHTFFYVLLTGEVIEAFVNGDKSVLRADNGIDRIAI